LPGSGIRIPNPESRIPTGPQNLVISSNVAARGVCGFV